MTSTDYSGPIASRGYALGHIEAKAWSARTRYEQSLASPADLADALREIEAIARAAGLGEPASPPEPVPAGVDGAAIGTRHGGAA